LKAAEVAAPSLGWRAVLVSAVLVSALGALQTLAFVHTTLWWLPLLCIAVLAALVARCTPAQAALLGWLFGSAWLGSGVWWLFISLHRYGGLPAPLAVAAVALLAMALSLYLALAMALFARWRRGRVWLDAPLFALLWVLAELARTIIFTGFPWLATGYSQIDSPLAALAPWVGVSGIGATVALMSMLLAHAWLQRGRPLVAALSAGAVPVALMLPVALGTVDFSAPGGRLTVSLLQSNVAQDEKFAADRMPAALAWVGSALESAQGDHQLPLRRLQRAAHPTGRVPAWLLAGHSRTLRELEAGRADRRANGRLQRRLHQLGARPVGGYPWRRALPLRQGAPGALRRVHSDRLSLVHRDDEHPARGLRAWSVECAIVRLP
jgi:Apolipoprotein N-acyltransferase N-terminal domain